MIKNETRSLESPWLRCCILVIAVILFGYFCSEKWKAISIGASFAVYAIVAIFYGNMIAGMFGGGRKISYAQNKWTFITFVMVHFIIAALLTTYGVLH